MKKLFIYLSIILHIVVITISLFKFSNIFDKKIEDNGYSVFDFVSIVDKSTSPILSRENGRASKTKSYSNNDKKEENNINKQNDNMKQKHEEKNDNKEIKKDKNNDKKEEKKNKSIKDTQNEIKDQKKNKDIKDIPNKLKNDKKQKINKQIKENKIVKKNIKKNDNKQNKNSSSKQSNKNNSKALVNLKQNKKYSGKKNNNNKKSLNSFLDSVLADGDNENTGANAESLGDTLTATQIDQVRNTIRKCWHFPAGLKDAETLVVDIKMELDRSGYVKKAEVVDKNRMKRDSGFKIAAENAQRAVLDPSCNPLPLPKEKYEEWKNLELSFNPKDML